MKTVGTKQVTAQSPPADLIAYYGGAASDVYFQRAHKTLTAAHVDAVVAMDFFSSKAGILCGVAEAVRLLGGTVKAALAFDEAMGDDVLRIVLVDTFKDEAEEALRVAAALGKRLRGVRLDTPGERGGVTVELVKEVRARLDLAGFEHVGIFVSGGLDAPRIAQFEAAKCPSHSYGVGMAISSAPPIAFTADIKEIAGKPVTKRGRIPGAAPNARLVRVI